MDKLSQEQFDNLIDLDINSMSEDQLAFLMARRGYMNAVQTERYAKTIKLHEAGKLFKAKAEEGSDDLDGLALKALVAVVKAEKLDIDTKGLKADELREAIREARVAEEE